MIQTSAPLVTIAIPAFKSHWLAEAIQSAINQTYKNIEIIIVDDDSPQNLLEIVYPFLLDSRIHYYKNDRNLGSDSIVLNWNRCLELAQGDYFVLLCDDDFLEPTFVSSLLALAYKYPQSCVMHARKYNMYADGHKEESPVWPEYEYGDAFLKQRLERRRHHTISEFLIRTSSLHNIGGYVVFPSGFYSDNASIIALAQEGGIASSQNCLITFRNSDEHITSSYSSKNCWDKYLAALAYWEWINAYEVAKEHKNEIREELENTIFYSFRYAPWPMKLKMLVQTPAEIVSLKHKIGFLISQ